MSGSLRLPQRCSQRRGWLVELGVVAIVAALTARLPLMHAGLLAGLAGGGMLLLHYPWCIWPVLGVVLAFAAGVEIGPIAGSDLILAVAIALWFVDGVRRRRLLLRGGVMPALILLYALVLGVTALQAQDLGEAAKEAVKWLEVAALVMLAPVVVPQTRRAWLAAGILLGGVLQAVLGLAQFVLQIGPDWFILFERFMRASGSFAQPNPYAGYLGVTLPVAVSLALWSWGTLWRRTNVDGAGWAGTEIWISVTALLTSTAALIIALGLAASWSRGAWLGAVAGMGVVLLFRSRRSLIAGLALAVAAATAIMFGQLAPVTLPAPLAARFADMPTLLGGNDLLQQPVTDENFAVIERLAHWEAAVRMWEAAPWLGVGPGNYATVYPQVRLARWEDPLGHAHNIYLNVLAESGIVGLAAFLAMWLGIAMWLIGRRRRTMRPSWDDALALGVLGVLAHLAVHSTFDNLFVQGIYLQIGLWLAVVHLSPVVVKETS